MIGMFFSIILVAFPPSANESVLTCRYGVRQNSGQVYALLCHMLMWIEALKCNLGNA